MITKTFQWGLKDSPLVEHILTQECIPVGCISPASVAISLALMSPLPCTPLPLPCMPPSHTCPLSHMPSATHAPTLHVPCHAHPSAMHIPHHTHTPLAILAPCDSCSLPCTPSCHAHHCHMHPLPHMPHTKHAPCHTVILSFPSGNVW